MVCLPVWRRVWARTSEEHHTTIGRRLGEWFGQFGGPAGGESGRAAEGVGCSLLGPTSSRYNNQPNWP
ncbi:hypothetical protein E2562_024516 [Oryza meyeriana var. granulata]|uniref:Uncharacterized protein n=1 Tax=Oryza meyeriana var. granulata TaxID=110450 RepID=A0A6G1BNV8_9ORYZ|nr:hypothetical protein E2562_024516 [Oryza meyeriana var. granulata]